MHGVIVPANYLQSKTQHLTWNRVNVPPRAVPLCLVPNTTQTCKVCCQPFSEAMINQAVKTDSTWVLGQAPLVSVCDFDLRVGQTGCRVHDACHCVLALPNQNRMRRTYHISHSSITNNGRMSLAKH